MQENVLAALDGERAYQQRRWGKDDVAEPKTVASYLTYIRHWARVAEEQVTKGGDHTALHTMRKITALGVACLEGHGAPTREQEEEAQSG